VLAIARIVVRKRSGRWSSHAEPGRGGHAPGALCDGDFRYSLLDEVEQSARGDGQFLGQGTGTFTGRLAGTAQWANFPRVSAGYAHREARGRIQSLDGGIVLFEPHGLSNLDDGAASTS
jgi:hypothetical protein